MEFWKEIFFLSLDSVFFCLSYSQYSFLSSTLRSIKKAEELGINPDPAKLKDSERHNVLVKGSVKSFSKDLIYSFYALPAEGVIQKITVTEHNITKNATGFWSDSKHLIQQVTNFVPFGIESDGYVVEINDFKDCYILDLDTVAATFEPTKLSILDYMVGFFNGVRQRGIETTEELLKEGTILTGVGELTITNGKKSLGPPSDGSAYILTVAPVYSVVRKLKAEQSTMRWLLLVFGTIGGVILGLLLRKGYKFYIYKMNEKETRKRLEETRRERRSAVRNNDEELPDSQCCVVCRVNPREVILLPCGHLCLCEDCNFNIKELCPICRAAINSKAPVFF